MAITETPGGPTRKGKPGRPAGITEKEWQREVCDIAAMHGWRQYHTWSSVHSAAGFPDLVLCRPPDLLVVELKSNTGKITEAQAGWLNALVACGVRCYVWRPSDLVSVLTVLKKGHKL